MYLHGFAYELQRKTHPVERIGSKHRHTAAHRISIERGEQYPEQHLEPSTELEKRAALDRTETQFHVETGELEDRSDWRFAEERATTKSYNVIGQVVIEFTHTVYWEYNGTEVRNVSHNSSHSTPSVFWQYKGITNDNIRVNERNAVSAMEGRFQLCGPKFACLQERNIGSKIWVQYQGEAAVQQI